MTEANSPIRFDFSNQNSNPAQDPNVLAYLRRAVFFLNDESWDNATEYFNKALDIDPNNEQAFVGLMLASMHYNSVEAFERDFIEGKIQPDKRYNNIKQFASGNLHAWFEAIEEAARRSSQQKNEKISSIVKKLGPAQKMIAAGDKQSLAVTFDGRVLATRYLGDRTWYYNQCNVSGMRDVVAVDTATYHSVGLRSDGTVVAVGRNEQGQCNVNSWRDIVAVAAGFTHTVGLRKDGTVVATQFIESDIFKYEGECDVQGWRDIVAIAAGGGITVGLKADGTVEIAGRKEDFADGYGVDGWKDIVSIAASSGHVVGIRKDGTVVTTRVLVEPRYYSGQFEVEDWKDVVAVSVGGRHVVGLRADGSVIATPFIETELHHYHGQCDVSTWRNIIAVSAGDEHTIGLRADGTLVSTGFINHREFQYSEEGLHLGQCDVEGWRLFNNYYTIEQDKQRIKDQRREQLVQQLAAARERKEQLERDLNSVSGAFAGMKKRKLEGEIAEAQRRITSIATQLNNLD